MKQISITEFKRLTKVQMLEEMPLELLAEGFPFAIVASLDGVIVIEDLHPRVQNQLKAQEKRARVGMPRVEKFSPERLTLAI